jgi:Holliday junction resolvasome RuvABC endonuclease subunit
MVIAGIDPSLSNFGLAKGAYENGHFDLTHISLAETQPDSKNKQVRKNSQDLLRASTLHKATKEWLSDVDLVIAEVPVGSQSARAMASYGVCIGLLASLDKPLIQVMPNEVKIAAVGNKLATKEDMINWAAQLYPTMPWLTQKRQGITYMVKKNEHIADAVGAIHAGLASDTFKQLLTFKGTMNV